MSQLSSSPAQQTMMLLERAKSFSLGLKFVTSSGAVVDVTDASVLLKVIETPRYGSTVVLTAEAEFDGDPVDGFMRIDLQATDLDLTPRVYLFAIVMHAASGYSGVLAKGELEIVANGETESLDLTYPGVNPSQILEVLLGDNNEVTVKFPSFEYPELVIGDVTTVGYGNPAAATVRGRYPVQILDLSLPHGVGIYEMYIESGRLKVTLTNGVTQDVGALPAHPGTGADLLDDLSDVDTVTSPPLVADTLMFDGTEWMPASAVEIDGGVPEYVPPGTLDGGAP